MPQITSNPHDTESHSTLVYDTWESLGRLVESQKIEIDGDGLDIASVVAVARYGCIPVLKKSPEMLEKINGSVSMLDEYLAKGYYVYGVNTGFGGSADTRTNELFALQRSLLQLQQTGVLGRGDKSEGTLDNEDFAFPPSLVKGTMLVRCNTLVRGHSSVSIEVIEAIMKLLRNRYTPMIPLRGTISASGDLLPLSYIAGVVEGNPDVMVRVREGKASKIVAADEALAMVGEKPLTLGPKEGLGLINGTAASAALASLVLYEVHHLAILTQVLTATAVEALLGNAESFHPFIAQIRPHQGQIEVATNVRRFLAGSKLARGTHLGNGTQTKSGLVQDRYSLRTASQWIGPQLEDLMLAHRQVTTELNSTTDNPLIDVSHGKVYSCGNFQAASITSAMEKTRMSIQMLGKLLFAQCSQLINPALSNGLPANLAFDDPSLSFTMKGIDINMAAYTSELGFLANPVSTHVQSAEMHNQDVNSLAFISARYTMQAVDVLSLMCAAYLYVVCQALDLRVMHLEFILAFQPAVESITSDVFGTILSSADIGEVHLRLAQHVPEAWSSTTTLDLHPRAERLVDSCSLVLLKTLSSRCSKSACSFTELDTWKHKMLSTIISNYTTHRAAFSAHPTTINHLGRTSRMLYQFVRNELGVPLHQGLVEHPSRNGGADNTIDGREKKTIGTRVSAIYESLRDGRLHGCIMRSLGEGKKTIGDVDDVRGNSFPRKMSKI